MKSLEKHDKSHGAYRRNRREDPGAETFTVPRRQYSEANGNSDRAAIVSSASRSSTFLLIDVTPGIDPKSNRLEIRSTGPSHRAVLRLHQVSQGSPPLKVAPKSFGIERTCMSKETTGQGFFDRLSSNLSIGGMVDARPRHSRSAIHARQSLQVAMVSPAGSMPVAGAVSCTEHCTRQRSRAARVALDIATSRAGIINECGAHYASLAAGREYCWRTGQPKKVLLWNTSRRRRQCVRSASA